MIRNGQSQSSISTVFSFCHPAEGAVFLGGTGHVNVKAVVAGYVQMPRDQVF
jgi:hypothetical protein